MITHEEAKTIALTNLAEVAPGHDLVIRDEQTIVKPYGWFPCVAALRRDRNFLYLLGGAGLLVLRHNGRIHHLPGRTAAEPTIAEFEKKHGLKG